MQEKKVQFDVTKLEKLEMCHNIQADKWKKEKMLEYDLELADMMATIMCNVNSTTKQ